MRRVGLKNYLTDRRFTAEKCSFETDGYPPNYGSAVTANHGSSMLNSNLNTGPQSSAYDLGYCGTNTQVCDFTVFVPNSSAIDYFSASSNGHKVMRDTPRFQWVSQKKGENC
jgi:hypothetical protein